MVLEAEVARSMGVLGAATVGRLSRCLKAHGLPITVSDPRIANSPNAQSMTVPKLMKIMKLDKKNAGAVKKVVLLSRIGKTHEEKASAVPDSIIASILSPVMQVLPGPSSVSEVTMSTPGSKSVSNRALVLAALAKGTCKISNLLHSDDTQVMMSALQAMQGASFTWEDNGETLVVTGNGGRLSVSKYAMIMRSANDYPSRLSEIRRSTWATLELQQDSSLLFALWSSHLAQLQAGQSSRATSA